MKNLLLQLGFFLPAAIFAIYVLMILLGCGAACFGAGDAFYCGIFCKLGVSLVAMAVIVTLYFAVRKT